MYGVHITTIHHVGHIEIVYAEHARLTAMDYARQQSQLPGVLHTSVTEFTLGSLGTRKPVVWYRHGEANPNDRPFAHGSNGTHDPRNPH